MLTTNQRDILAGAFTLVKLIEQMQKAENGETYADARNIINLYQSWRNAIETVDIAMGEENGVQEL